MKQFVQLYSQIVKEEVVHSSVKREVIHVITVTSRQTVTWAVRLTGRLVRMDNAKDVSIMILYKYG